MINKQYSSAKVCYLVSLQDICSFLQVFQCKLEKSLVLYEIESVIWVQILDEIGHISLYSNVLGEKHESIFSPLRYG